MVPRNTDDVLDYLEVEVREPRPKDMDDRFRLMHEALEAAEATDESEKCAGALSKFWSHRSGRIGRPTQQEDE